MVMLTKMDAELASLTTELANADSANLDIMSTIELVSLMNKEDMRVPLAVQKELPNIAKAIDAIADRMKTGGRLIYVGCGTSGRLGALDAAECPVTFGSEPGKVVGLMAGRIEALSESREEVEDSFRQPILDLNQIQLQKQDSVVGLSASGRTPYVIGAIRHARKIQCITVGISCNAQSQLQLLADYPITPVVGPEVLTGSTRLKAATAQKLVLNMLSTGTMVKLGRCYGNLMVDFDGAACSKLKHRAQRIVMQVAKCDTEVAVKLLEQCQYRTKTAILMHLAQIDLKMADDLLKFSGGRLRDALHSCQKDV